MIAPSFFVIACEIQTLPATLYTEFGFITACLVLSVLPFYQAEVSVPGDKTKALSIDTQPLTWTTLHIEGVEIGCGDFLTAFTGGDEQVPYGVFGNFELTMVNKKPPIEDQWLKLNETESDVVFVWPLKWATKRVSIAYPTTIGPVRIKVLPFAAYQV